MDEYGTEYLVRAAHIEKIGFPVIDPEMVEALVALSPLVEIGAGTGALALAIRAAGGKIVATDSYTGEYGLTPEWHGSMSPVIKADASRAARLVAKTKDVNLLCSWPCYMEDWCTKAIAHLPKGRRFAYIGEGRDGCTGDDSLHDMLESDFVIEDAILIPTWAGIRDRLIIYRRS